MGFTLFYVFILSVSLKIYSQNTFGLDDRFESSLIKLWYHYGPSDNYALIVSIDAIILLSIISSKRDNLNGIHKLTALKYLHCSSFGLWDLDI